MPNPNIYKVPDPLTPHWYNTVYLRSRFWRWRRLQYMMWSDGRCEITNCTRKATVLHHLSYEHLYCEPNTDLIALCRDCHAWMHKWPDNDNNQIEFLFQKLETKSS